MKKLLFLFVLAFNTHLLYAQTYTCGDYKGDMLISDAPNLKQNLKTVFPNSYTYNTSKFNILDSFVKTADSKRTFLDTLEYSVANILEVIRRSKRVTAFNGLRMYLVAIAETTNSNDASLTNGMLNQVVPVWVPTKKGIEVYNSWNCVDDQKVPICYYIDAKNNKVVQLSKETIISWRDNYLKIHTKLKEHLGKPPVGNTKNIETRSVWYSSDAILQFEKYVDSCFKPEAIMTMDFVSFNETDERNYKVLGKKVFVSRQLNLVFHFSDDDYINKANENIKRNSKKLGTTALKSWDSTIKQYNALSKNKNKNVGEAAKLKMILMKFIKTNRVKTEDFDTGLPCPPDDHCIDLETP